jgi:Tfp pilus assembly protein PilN
MALRDINLIPADIQTRRVLNRHIAFWAGCLTFSLSLIFSFYLYEKHVVLAPKSTFGSLKDAHTHLGFRIQEIKQIQEEIERLDQQQAVLEDITRSPVVWRIVFRLAEIMNESTWLHTLTTDVSRDKQKKAGLQLNGFSFSNEELGNFLIKLSSEPMFKDVLLKYARETTLDRTEKDDAGQIKVIEFEIECELLTV